MINSRLHQAGRRPSKDNELELHTVGHVGYEVLPTSEDLKNVNSIGPRVVAGQVIGLLNQGFDLDVSGPDFLLLGFDEVIVK